MSFWYKTPNVKISIIDMSGSVVLSRSQEEGNLFKFNLTNHARGIYFVKIESAEKTFVKKLILK